jgi:hypothetical protein
LGKYQREYKISDNEFLGQMERKEWFDEEFSQLIHQRKQAELCFYGAYELSLGGICTFIETGH